MSLRRFLIILTAFFLIGITLTLWYFPSNDDFRVENPFWNGISRLSEGYPVHELDSVLNIDSLPPASTIITVSYIEYTREELKQLDIFITEGGRLIIADDYGYGNDILRYLGLDAGFESQVLLDPVLYYKNKHFPLITHLVPDPVTANITHLAFNHATSLTGVAGDEVLALSSPFSFLDSNGNEEYDIFESTGPLPVISRHEVGSGQVILIADPSIFINAMTGVEDNAVLIQNIAATSTALYIDQTHLMPSELNSTKGLLVRARRALANAPGTLSLVIAAAAVTLIPLWYRRKTTR